MERSRVGDAGKTRTTAIVIRVDGEDMPAEVGESLAAALISGGHYLLRRSPRAGGPRGAFCHMGVCRECRVLVDGKPVLACVEPVRNGMSVTLGLRS